VIKTLPPGALTSYPQAKALFRSEKRTIRAVERLDDRLTTLQAKVDELDSLSRKLQLEWIETYDKIRHQLSRMARRGDLSNGKDPVPNVDDPPPEEPEMDPISAGIHRRRNRTFLGRQ